MKQVELKVIRPEDHPWNPNVVEFDIIHMQPDGEPYVDVSGILLPNPSITSATTMGEIKAACEAYATAQGWLP
jgi:hypothetical protein